MDEALYGQTHIAGDNLHSQSSLVPPSEATSTPTNYYSIQNPYLPASTPTPCQNTDQPAASTTIASGRKALPATINNSTATSNILESTPPLPTATHADDIVDQERVDQPHAVLTPSPPSRSGQQKCTRCKRWKLLDQFKNGTSSPLVFVGCLECRETAKKYGQSEFGKATRRNYNQTTKAKETRKKYARSEKGRESRKKYAQTKKAKETRKKYNQSEKAKAARRKRALVKTGQQQEQQEGGKKRMESTAFEMAPGFTNHITFDPSQQVPSEKMNPMERAFWQTVTKTMYDQAKRHYDHDVDGHDKFEVDIQLKYRRAR
ncbi:unnamed protein product [Absidia cylindrospora]